MSELVLIPELEDQIKPLFETEEDYEQFQQDFSREMVEVLERQREARLRSEEESRQKWIR